MNQDDIFPIAYTTATLGATIIATTAGYYFGARVVASAADSTMSAYDNASTITGRCVDMLMVDFNISPWLDGVLKYPLYVKNGLTVNITETGTKAVVFFSPKG